MSTIYHLLLRILVSLSSHAQNLGVAQNLCDKGLKGQFRIFSALDLWTMSLKPENLVNAQTLCALCCTCICWTLGIQNRSKG